MSSNTDSVARPVRHLTAVPDLLEQFDHLDPGPDHLDPCPVPAQEPQVLDVTRVSRAEVERARREHPAGRGVGRDRVGRDTGGRDRVGRARGVLRAVVDDAGAATAEYAIVVLAAVGFAGLLVVILRGNEVKSMLTDLIHRALAGG